MNSGYKLNLEWIPLAYRSKVDKKGEDNKTDLRANARQEAGHTRTQVKGIYKRGTKKLDH